MNALAGAAVGEHYGLTNEQIRAGIEQVEHVAGRLNIIETGAFTVIDDCYNANPMSMKAAVDVLADAKTGERAAAGRTVAILGDMFELGPDELAMHAEVGTHAAGRGIDLLIAVGARSKSLYEAAEAAGMKNAHWFESVEDLLPVIRELTSMKDTILVKASHAMGFERIVEALKQE